MKAARAFVFVAICMFAGQADASCFGWGSPGYGALASDCGFADSLWAGYCSGGPVVSASDCCEPCCAGFGWYGANAGGCDTGCGGGGGGCQEWLARMRCKLQSRTSSQSCGSSCSPGGSWCDSGDGGCGGGGGCGGCGSGMLGSGRSMGLSSGFGSCGSGCGGGCGGGLQSGWQNLRSRLMGGCCGRRYQSLNGCESMCENARGFGSFRSWIGGGPLDACGLVSYDSFPAHGIDYSYLNYCSQAAAATAPVDAHAQPTLATPPADHVLDESGSTTTMTDEMSESIYDETQSFEPAADFDATRSSELIPHGEAVPNGE